MLIAGEASGDALGAELVRELRAALARTSTYSASAQPLEADLAPEFFGAGGPRMAEAGVEMAFDLTQESLIGLPGPKVYLRLRRRMNQLIALAREREPHAIICVDFQLFNSTFAAAVAKYVRDRAGTFNNWAPKLIKYISPQVWASRAWRAQKIARDFDMVLSIIPFERDWYAGRTPGLRVEFIGHPMVERLAGVTRRRNNDPAIAPRIVLLPGSRRGELKRHWPVMLEAWRRVQAAIPTARAKAVLPNEDLAAWARAVAAGSPIEAQAGGLDAALAEADLAISKTGTITLECAFFGVPAVTMYKVSPLEYQIGKRIVKVKWASMPNLLANEAIFPEFIQAAASPDNLAEAALKLLKDAQLRSQVRTKLENIVSSLGGPGASRRAAESILSLMRVT